MIINIIIIQLVSFLSYSRLIFLTITFAVSFLTITAQNLNRFQDTISLTENNSALSLIDSSFQLSKSLGNMNIGMRQPIGEKLKDTSVIFSDSSKLFSRKKIVGAGFLLNTAGVLYSGHKWWWKGEYHKFNFQYEGFLNDYAYGVDKCGHFYISYLYFNVVLNTMKWGGYSDKISTRTAIFIPFLWALTIEIADGYTKYAFSPDDLFANSLGITYGLLQTKYPYLQNFHVKWSYFPTDVDKWMRNDLSFTADYDGHFYWLSCNTHELLPSACKKYWPKFLNLAVGYGALNVSHGSTAPKIRKFAIGLDYNLAAIPIKGNTTRVIIHMLDYLKFPAPAFRKVQAKKGELKGFLLY